MTLPADTRSKIIACARAHVGARTPYQWGGGHHGPSWGLDCSGLVLDCAKSAGFDPGAWDSAMMRSQLPVTETPQPGDVALYAPRHVVIVESFDRSTGIATIIGANGGDSSTTSPERAAEQDARVKWEPTQFYRTGFQGFRSIAPWGVPDYVPTARSSASSSWPILVGAVAVVGAVVWRSRRGRA